MEMGISIRKAEHWINAKLFLDEYAQWDIEEPHHPIILHSMFLHVAGEGRKKQRVSSAKATSKAYPSQIPKETLMDYQTSWKEIQDLNHEVYLQRRSPSLPICGPQLREEAIQDT